MVYVLKIHNSNLYWKIIATEIFIDNRFFDTSQFFEVSKDVYDHIKDKLQYNNIIIEKVKLVPTVSIDDFVYDAVEYESVLKYNAWNTVYNAFQGRCTIIHQLEIINYILCNNKLIEMGYVITDENKDEQYINIIKSENDELISALEKLLYAKDYIADPYYWFTEYIKFKEELEIAETQDDINKVTQNFLDKLQ